MKQISRRTVMAAGLGGALAMGTQLAQRPQAAQAAVPMSGGLNPVVDAESAPLTKLRQQLNRAARGGGGFEKDEAGRSIVVAPEGTHVLLRTLVIGPNTALRAHGATFTCDFPLVPATYKADRASWHSPTPTYPDEIQSYAVDQITKPTLLMNQVPSDETGLYSAPGNIRVEGGTWDPTAHYLRDSSGDEALRATAAPPMDAMAFQHTHDVEVVGVTIRNVKWWHALEFNAVKTAIVKESRFEGWIENPTTGLWNGEAVQFDMPWDSNKWAGLGDKAPAQDIRIVRNHCGPSATQPGWAKFAGSHSSAPQQVYTDIWIERNTIEQSKWDAILAMNASRIVIRENLLTDCRGGIYVKTVSPNPLETVDIIGNDISLQSGTDRPVIGVVGQSASVAIHDVAVYGNTVAGGGFWYAWAHARRPLQK
ncbi:right-handed parallel beta-helix repeat-containing protein [Microbacterium sp.]|uniref:right-handed parallel beta-helix repeat-containing protein n=1 Tax=Microbacterium sp. TaxID=51671 RepID=UPI0028117A68|nr:right-handed parallel beta-helix repeat-containing protein [Microbacterium sp.]